MQIQGEDIYREMPRGYVRITTHVNGPTLVECKCLAEVAALVSHGAEDVSSATRFTVWWFGTTAELFNLLTEK